MLGYLLLEIIQVGLMLLQGDQLPLPGDQPAVGPTEHRVHPGVQQFRNLSSHDQSSFCQAHLRQIIIIMLAIIIIVTIHHDGNLCA